MRSHLVSGPVALRDVLASQLRYDDIMKTATLPSIRVEQAFRDELEASLKKGETISEFIESAVRGTLQRRSGQAEFVARGMASLEEARRTGVTYPAEAVIRKLEEKLEEALERRAAATKR